MSVRYHVAVQFGRTPSWRLYLFRVLLRLYLLRLTGLTLELARIVKVIPLSVLYWIPSWRLYLFRVLLRLYLFRLTGLTLQLD